MKCFILVGTFSASLKKSLCELSPSSQATLQRSRKQAHMKRVCNIGKQGLMAMAVLKLMCNCKNGLHKGITKGS